LLKQTAAEYGKVLKKINDNQLINKSDTSVILINLDILENRLSHLKEVFPSTTLHAIAVKTNPLLGVLKHIKTKGFGLEAASFGEIMLAHKVGISPSKLVYDAPVKNLEELRYCNTHFAGLKINANTINELKLYQGLTNIKLGLRINMLARPGSEKMFDVSQPLSKFGELIEHRAEILHAFLTNEQLVGLHIHIGSQINQLDEQVNSIKQLFELAKEIEQARKQAGIKAKIEYLDIGGGFPANYGDQPQMGMESYVTAIKEKCPGIFEDYEVITEFGRFVHAHTSWLYSQINSLITNKYGNIALVYQGANLFVREVYTQKSPHRFFCLDHSFRIKENKKKDIYQIGGPLCFAGDFIARDILLPSICLDDSLVISDIGANTFSLYSRHCSIPFPKVIAYSQEENNLRVIKERETVEGIIEFWA